MGRSEQDNHAIQMNPNNDAYWQSRGYDGRPEDWQEQIQATQGADDREHQGQEHQGR